MVDRVYTYVDGESHFIRLEKAWQSLHGSQAKLEHLCITGQQGSDLILHMPHAKVFWTRHWSPGQRTFYFTSAAGDEGAIYDIKKKMREFGLDHQIVRERKTLADQRRALLNNSGVIEKAKTVDAEIFVKMLGDAYSDLYDLCNLYTSDVDYLPVIKAVMNLGKRVYVHGFKSGLSDRSPLEHEPSKFLDLNEALKSECQWIPPR